MSEYKEIDGWGYEYGRLVEKALSPQIAEVYGQGK